MIKYLFIAAVIGCLALPWFLLGILGAIIADLVILAIIFLFDWLLPVVRVEDDNWGFPHYKVVYRFSEQFKNRKRHED